MDGKGIYIVYTVGKIVGIEVVEFGHIPTTNCIIFFAISLLLTVYMFVPSIGRDKLSIFVYHWGMIENQGGLR